MDELVGIVPEVCQDPTLPRNDENQCPKVLVGLFLIQSKVQIRDSKIRDKIAIIATQGLEIIFAGHFRYNYTPKITFCTEFSSKSPLFDLL